MPKFVTVAKASEIPPGTARAIEVGDRMIALFNVNGRFYATDNTCLHRGGPVGEGDLEESIVTCPWHGWQYDVTSGRNVADPSIGLAPFEVLVDGDDVRVAVG